LMQDFKSSFYKKLNITFKEKYNPNRGRGIL